MKVQKVFQAALGALMALTTSLVWAEEVSKYNMTKGVTEISNNVWDLHMIIFWVCVVIGAIVFGAIFYSIFAHRKSKGVTPATFSHSTKAEIIWTAIPFVILVLMAIPATKTLIKIEKAPETEMTIKVTGYQWKWHYEYQDNGIAFMSNLESTANEARQLGSGVDVTKVANYLLDVDEPMVVPVDTNIRILTTAADVIHSWWVPALGWKRDAIPGFVNESWTNIQKPGVYRGQCAELCGKDHGFMPIVIVAKSKEDYAKWVDEKKAQIEAAASGDNRDDFTLAELMERGEKVYQTNCAACHQANGKGLPPSFPSLVDSPITTQSDNLAKHVDIVVNGVPGTAMAAYGATLSKADIAAVVTYERNAWGLNTGELVQPVEIQSAK